MTKHSLPRTFSASASKNTKDGSTAHRNRSLRLLYAELCLSFAMPLTLGFELDPRKEKKEIIINYSVEKDPSSVVAA